MSGRKKIGLGYRRLDHCIHGLEGVGDGCSTLLSDAFDSRETIGCITPYRSKESIAIGRDSVSSGDVLSIDQIMLRYSFCEVDDLHIAGESYQLKEVPIPCHDPD